MLTGNGNGWPRRMLTGRQLIPNGFRAFNSLSLSLSVPTSILIEMRGLWGSEEGTDQTRPKTELSRYSQNASGLPEKSTS